MKFIKGQINWGIIGCGDVCEVKSGPAFGKVPGSNLVAVMRRDAEKAKDYALRHQVPKSYDDANNLIQDKDVNAIYIATPPGSHESYALAAMQAGKPVYIEKPVTTSSTSCRNMIDASKSYSVPVTVAHYRRKLQLFERVKSLIAEDAIGQVRLITINLLQLPKAAVRAGDPENWRVNPNVSGGGLLHDLGPHQLDILYWLFGPPENVKGNAVNQGGNYDAADVSTISAIYKGNIMFHGMWSFNSPKQALADSCKIIGVKGTLEFPFFSSATQSKLTIQKADSVEVEEFIFPRHIQQPMINEVVNYFQGNGKNPCSLEESLISLEMIEVADLS